MAGIDHPRALLAVVYDKPRIEPRVKLELCMVWRVAASKSFALRPTRPHSSTARQQQECVCYCQLCSTSSPPATPIAMAQLEVASSISTHSQAAAKPPATVVCATSCIAPYWRDSCNGDLVSAEDGQRACPIHQCKYKRVYRCVRVTIAVVVDLTVRIALDRFLRSHAGRDRPLRQSTMHVSQRAVICELLRR